MALYEIVEGQLSGAFKNYGRFLSRNPIAIIAAALLVTGFLGLGLLRLESETDLDYLYTPENNRADYDKRRVSALFADGSGADFYTHQATTLGLYGDAIVVSENTSDNVLTIDVLVEIIELNRLISTFTVTVDGIEYGYHNVCAKRSGSCYVSGIQNLLNGTDVASFPIAKLTYPVVTLPAGPLYLPSIMGGVDVDEESVVISAEALRLRYYLRNDEEYRGVALLWEKEFLAQFSARNDTAIQIAHSTSQSLGDELNSGTSGDVTRFSITFTIMIFYATFVCGTGNCITSRGFLASTGVYSAGLAILASFGFCSYIGVKNVNIVGVMPFLIVGIGIDDMFILMSGWLETKPSDTVEGRVSGALGISAVSITITSLTNLLAFSIGATNVFPAVRNFCIYTGFAVIWCYLMQLTFFGGSLVLHTRRVKDERHCYTCTHIPPEDACKSRGKFWHCQWLFFCRGKKSGNAADDTEDRSIFERLPQHLAKFILLLPVKIIVIFVFAGYLAVSIWGALHLEQGLLLENLVPPSSYLHSYLRLERDYFSSIGPTISVTVDGAQAYWDTGVQQEVDSLLVALQNDNYVANDFQISWLDSFSSFHNGSLPRDESSFLESLRFDFLPPFPVFQGDLAFSDDGEITASRFYVRSVGSTSSYLQGQMMLRVREITDGSSLPAFAYTGAFIYFEQYVQVLPSTLQTVGCAVAAMFVVCLFFIPHILCVLYVTVAIVMITVGLFGFMYFWGLSLSSITMIHIVMSIGFSVDFCAHVCHAFMKADGIDRNHRLEVALSRVAVPILNGGISTFIGIVLLVDARSYVFLSFFRIMLLTIVFGVAHALLLLPVVLSIIGPSKKPIRELSINPNGVADNGDINLAFAESKSDLNGVQVQADIKV